MALPKQVEEAANLAQELHTQMFAQEPENEQAQEVEQEGEVEEQAAAESNTEEESYESRYKVLQGKYNSEVPRLHNELKELKEMVFSRLGEVAKEQPKEEPKPAIPADKLAEWEEQFGADFLEMQRTLARLEAEELLSKRLAPVEQQVNTVEEAQISAARQNFSTYLDEKVKGDWRNLWSGQDEGFIEFLQKPDPSGLYTYGQLARAYNDNWDADKLATVFQSYIDSKAPVKQQAPNPAQAAAIAPSRSTQHATPNASEARVWTGEMVREFQRNDRMGKYDAETSKAMWDDLLKAPSENRIRP